MRAGSPTPGRSILMMRAPRSASWRVQKGPAITCSRATTVTPSSGRMSIFSVANNLKPTSHHEDTKVTKVTKESKRECRKSDGCFRIGAHARHHRFHYQRAITLFDFALPRDLRVLRAFVVRLKRDSVQNR